jgi:flagellar motor protein MotB
MICAREVPPVTDNSTSSGKQANRRVSILVG